MILLCHITTRVEGDKHPGLLREKGGSGFPFLVFMDSDGNVIAKQGERTVAGFQKTVAALSALPELQQKAASGDKVAAADLLLAEIALGKVDFATAQERAGKVAAMGAIEPGKQKQLDGALVDLEVEGMMGARTAEAVAERGAKFLAMLQEGRVPTGRMARSFYMTVLGTAQKQNDVKSYEQALGELTRLMADQKGADVMLRRYQETLAKMKADGGGK